MMRLFSPLVLALALAASASAGELDLTLTTAGGKAIPDAVVMVRPDGGSRGAPRLAGPFVMAQKAMQFQPYVLIVPVGAEVAFPNLDPFHHHVYSFSAPKTFELKLYGQAEVRKVAFDKAGVVAIGCNIHDNMSAYIRVVDTPFAAKTAVSGLSVVRDLPPGPATVTVWHPYLKAAQGEVTQRVVIPGTGVLRLAVKGELKTPRLRRGAY
jgi:plastocyanin